MVTCQEKTPTTNIQEGPKEAKEIIAKEVGVEAMNVEAYLHIMGRVNEDSHTQHSRLIQS